MKFDISKLYKNMHNAFSFYLDDRLLTTLYMKTYLHIWVHIKHRSLKIYCNKKMFQKLLRKMKTIHNLQGMAF